MAFNFGPSIKTFNQIASDFIAGMGKPCELYYPPIEISCPNCTNGYIYLQGGPVPFTNNSPCPYCGGTNKIVTPETHETIYMMVYYNPKDFIKYQEFDAGIADGMVQTRGLISDASKVERISYAIIHNNVDGINQMRYVREGEMVPCGASLSQEFLQMWKRTG